MGLGACSGNVPEAEVNFVMLPPQAESMSNPADAFPGKQPSGLINEGFCYGIHATAPDLNDPELGTNKSTCDSGPRGKGITFGPYPYGSDASISVKSGAERQFDLIGFKNPFADDLMCSKELKFTKVASTDANGNPQTQLQITYGGEKIDPETLAGTNPDPNSLMYLMGRSSILNIAPGKTSVVLQAREWIEKDYIAGSPLMYPVHYKEDVLNLGRV